MKNRLLPHALILMLIAVPASAETLSLRIFPDEAPPYQICTRQSNEDAAVIWRDWDGVGLNGRSFAEARQDIKTLRKFDPVVWAPVISKIIANLAARDTRFSGKTALIEEIETLHAAGLNEVLAERRLVPQLAELSKGTSGRTASVLAKYFRQGIGVPSNPELADIYLIKAAQAGRPEALFELAGRTTQGSAPSDWDLSAQDAVERAFEKWSKPLNRGVCDRIKRIISAYQTGRVIAPDPEMARIWQRYAADLGDPQAAWKLYEAYARAETVESDHSAMMAYLRQAADANLPYAQIALGRHLERGVLVAQDIEQAFSLYKSAAANEHRAGLIRLALFLEERVLSAPELDQQRLETLTKLSRLEDAPGWVFLRLGKHAQREHGHWSSQAKSWFERGWQAQDMESGDRLATLLFATRTVESFNRATAILADLVHIYGSTSAAKALHQAYLCRAPEGARLSEAEYWRDVYLAMDPPLGVEDNLAALSISQKAALQSQALYRRSSAVGLWMSMIASEPENEAMVSFWSDYAHARHPKTNTEDAPLFASLESAIFDPQSLKTLLHQAIAIMPCDYKSVRSAWETAFARGEFLLGHQLLRIGAHLHRDKTWALVDYADALQKYAGEASSTEVASLHEQAMLLGDPAGTRKYLKFLAQTGERRVELAAFKSLWDQASSGMNLGQSSVLIEATLDRRHALPAGFVEDIGLRPLVRSLSGQIAPSVERRYALYLLDAAQTQADLFAAFGWLTRAAEGGDVRAMIELGQAYLSGIGVAKNIDKGRAYLSRAEIEGSTEAGRLLRTFELALASQ